MAFPRSSGAQGDGIAPRGAANHGPFPAVAGLRAGTFDFIQDDDCCNRRL
jgi:hypothetical protein